MLDKETIKILKESHNTHRRYKFRYYLNSDNSDGKTPEQMDDDELTGLIKEYTKDAKSEYTSHRIQLKLQVLMNEGEWRTQKMWEKIK